MLRIRIIEKTNIYDKSDKIIKLGVKSIFLLSEKWNINFYFLKNNIIKKYEIISADVSNNNN